MKALINYYQDMEAIFRELEGTGRSGEDAPELLLHSCCGPCSIPVIKLLSKHFKLSVFFYNPNIDDLAEYNRRESEQRKVLDLLGRGQSLPYIVSDYNKEEFLEKIRGLEGEREGGKRCTICYALRIKRAVAEAAMRGFEWVTTTLSVGAMKDAFRINNIGKAAAAKAGIQWLPSDFKKRGGGLESVEFCKQNDIYRQDYCGCSFSRRERDST